ncbi:MAG: hypothetical protein WCF78_00830 [archaeon]
MMINKMTILLYYERRNNWLKKQNKENDLIFKDKSRFLQRDIEINCIIAALESKGFELIPICSKDDLNKLLYQKTNNLVGWNITDGYDIYDGAHFPSTMRLLGIPYVMEETYIQALAQNKDHFKSIIRQWGILTPNWITISYKTINYKIKIPFSGPYIVKPAKLDNSIGLIKGNKNIFKNRNDALRFAYNHSKKYDSPMMIEEFIDGNDISTPYAFFDNRFHSIALREVIFNNWKDYKYQSNILKDKREKRMEKVNIEITNNILKIIKLLIEKLNLNSYGRFDFRESKDGKLYLLEFNPGTSLTGLQFEKFYDLNNITLADFLEKMILSVKK